MTNLKNKKVLITGITGFIGAHLEKKLAKLGAEVFGVSTTKAGKNILTANIADFSPLSEFIAKHKIDICFHLAGESLVESGQKDPYHTFKTNVLGTLNVLESARLHGLEKIVIASTSHVYGNSVVPYLEEYPPRPSRPYETSKTATDLITQSYATTFSLPVFIPRFTNIYGPGDLNFSRLIPKIMKNIALNEAVSMWGGAAKRSFLYIDDAIEAYIKLALADPQKVGHNRIFNFGHAELVSIKELIQKAIQLSGKKIPIEESNQERPLEIPEQYVSFQKAQNTLDWSPEVSLELGLQKTYSWYSQYLSHKKE